MRKVYVNLFKGRKLHRSTSVFRGSAITLIKQPSAKKKLKRRKMNTVFFLFSLVSLSVMYVVF